MDMSEKDKWSNMREKQGVLYGGRKFQTLKKEFKVVIGGLSKESQNINEK